MATTAVIPAKAGIQTAFADIRALRLDSRLRGNDAVGVREGENMEGISNG